MATPLISFKALHRLSLGLVGAIASSLLISVSGALAQVFQYGDTGSSVAEIQSQLGVYPDGVFGIETEDAVASFQSRNGLAVDGVVGPETLNALGLSYLGSVGGPTDDFSSSSSFGSTTNGLRSAVVRTPSGIGVNIRNAPNGQAIGGLDDGARVPLTGRQQVAGGLTWAEIDTAGSGWVATDFLVFNGGIGGPSDPVNPIGSSQGRYVVAVPGSSPSDLRTARFYYPAAFIDEVNQGTFINAGAFSNRSDAERVASNLRREGLDARVSVRRLW